MNLSNNKMYFISVCGDFFGPQGFFFRKKRSWGAAVKIDYSNFKSWRNAPRSNISMAFSVSKRVLTRSIVENCPPKPIPANLCFKKGLKPIFWRDFHRGVSFFTGFYRRVGFFSVSKCSWSYFCSNPYIKNVGWGRLKKFNIHDLWKIIKKRQLHSQKKKILFHWENCK